MIESSGLTQVSLFIAFSIFSICFKHLSLSLSLYHLIQIYYWLLSFFFYFHSLFLSYHKEHILFIYHLIENCESGYKKVYDRYLKVFQSRTVGIQKGFNPPFFKNKVRKR